MKHNSNKTSNSTVYPRTVEFVPLSFLEDDGFPVLRTGVFLTTIVCDCWFLLPHRENGGKTP